MAFALEPHESPRRGIRRILRAELSAALAHAARTTGPGTDDAIHELRKTFKRLRSLLRLIHFDLEGAAYRFQNKAFRNAGRRLAQLRDDEALREALAKLARAAAPGLDTEVVAEVRETVEWDQRQVPNRDAQVRDALAATADFVQQALDDLPGWANRPFRKRRLLRGVRAVYKQGRSAYRRAARRPTVERLHEWRKEAKYLRHQLEVLTPLAPAVIGPLARAADELGQRLGDDHDLAMLRRAVKRHARLQHAEAIFERLDRMIAQRRSELQSAALELGAKLYADSPRQFVERLAEAWPSRRRDALPPSEANGAPVE